MISFIKTSVTRRGIRISQHGTVLSEVLREPGPTHSVVDVLAAAIEALSPGPRVAVLGFAGGGLLAPLRAMGGSQQMLGVDLDVSGHAVFQSLCGRWAGNVHFARADAVAWLRRQKAGFDAIVEDLSVGQGGDVWKPAVTWSQLPPLIHSRLKPRGIAVFNLLPPHSASWKHGLTQIASHFPRGVLIHLSDFENRILIAGQGIGKPREAGAAVRANLRKIKSKHADRISVRSCVWLQ